jgi:hypothetical protein
MKDNDTPIPNIKKKKSMLIFDVYKEFKGISRVDLISVTDFLKSQISSCGLIFFQNPSVKCRVSLNSFHQSHSVTHPENMSSFVFVYFFSKYCKNYILIYLNFVYKNVFSYTLKWNTFYGFHWSFFLFLFFLSFSPPPVLLAQTDASYIKNCISWKRFSVFISIQKHFLKSIISK